MNDGLGSTTRILSTIYIYNVLVIFVIEKNPPIIYTAMKTALF
jgi:hypothetical protein